MAWAATSGAISYREWDGSRIARLRERVTLSMVDRQLAYQQVSDSALRSAVLSRGTGWMTPASSAKVADAYEKQVVDALKARRTLVHPYDDGEEGSIVSKTEEQEMAEAYRRRFGGDPGSPEAEAEVRRQKAEALPAPPAAGTADISEEVVSRAATAWAAAMRPRSASHG